MPLVSKTFSEIITFTRATSATYFDATGTLQTATSGTPRFDYDPSTLAPRGFLIEEQRTNSIRNNTMVGAVAGTPGTLPTNWAVNINTTTGLTRTVVGTGTENGITYIDIKIAGTSVGAGALQIIFEQVGIIAASNNQTWTPSLYYKLAAGSLAGISSPLLRLQLFDNALASLGTVSSSAQAVPTTSSLSTQRISAALTTNNASTAFIYSDLRCAIADATAIDITLRIGLPQLEQGAFATSVIPTSTVAVTRNADVATVNTLSPWYNASAGTLYVEGTPNTPTTNGTNQFLASIDDGTQNNRLAIFRAASSGAYSAVVSVSGVATYAPQSGTWANGTSKKIALAYASGDQRMAYDGTLDATVGTSALPVVTKLSIGANAVSSALLNGWLRRITYYPRRLSNAELQTLTT